MNLLPLLVSLALAAADPATEGDGAVAPAGSQAAAVSLADGWSGWRGSLATGVTGKLGGMRLEGDERNSRVLLYFGAQAHGTLGERGRRAARVRLRLFTGGEGSIYAPSEGDAEAA